MNKEIIYQKLIKFQSYFAFLETDFVSEVLSITENKEFSSEKEYYDYSVKVLKSLIKEKINKDYHWINSKFFPDLFREVFNREDLSPYQKFKIFSVTVKALDENIASLNLTSYLKYPNLRKVLDDVFLEPENSYDKVLNENLHLKDFLDAYFALDNLERDTLEKYGSKKELSSQDMQELCKRSKLGSTNARDILVEQNKNLVYKICRYISYIEYSEGILSFDDLYQEGIMSLMKAVDNYDPARGTKFSTYSFYCIKATAIIYLIKNYSSLKLSRDNVDLCNKISRKVTSLENTLGRELTYDEIKEKLDLPDIEMRLYYAVRKGKYSLDKLMLDEYNENEPAETFPDDTNYFDLVEESIDDEALINICKESLNDKYFDILAKLEGFGTNILSIKDIREQYQVTKQNISRIYNRALKKISLNTKFITYFIKDEYLDSFETLKELCEDDKTLAYIVYRLNLLRISPLEKEDMYNLFTKLKPPELEKQAEAVLGRRSSLSNLYALFKATEDMYDYELFEKDSSNDLSLGKTEQSDYQIPKLIKIKVASK